MQNCIVGIFWVEGLFASLSQCIRTISLIPAFLKLLVQLWILEYLLFMNIKFLECKRIFFLLLNMNKYKCRSLLAGIYLWLRIISGNQYVYIYIYRESSFNVTIKLIFKKGINVRKINLLKNL